MPAHTLECAFRSHVGWVRAHNEDYLVCRSEQGVLVLGDGMGGHHAGEVASRVAVEAAADALCDTQEQDNLDALDSLLAVADAVELANAEVRKIVEEKQELQGMGTTLVLALFRESHVFFAHVGDSRLYRFRENSLQALTRDHSLIQELLDNGLFASHEEANKAGIGDNVLTRSVGVDPNVEVDVGDRKLSVGDVFLLCSDGLCGRVKDEAIEEICRSTDQLETIAASLEEAALNAGGRDNISLIVARVSD